MDLPAQDVRPAPGGVLTPDGEEILITVSGRPSAKLVPALQSRWHRWDDISDLFTGTVDPDWTDDRELLDDSIRDPWADR